MKADDTIRAKCFHPAGTFIEFKKEEIEQSISHRFEEQVRKYPDRLAVKTKDHALTYDELNKAANRVAHTILARCGKREKPIALLFEHDAPLIAAILGVLKAGKIYVPLDPSFPKTSITSMLADSQAELITTDNKNLLLARKLAKGTHQLINFDGCDANLPTDNPGLCKLADSLACLFYTSGSTGQPKGVIHNHRNVLQWVMNHTNDFCISRLDRLSLLYSCSFSASLHNLFAALLNTASIYPFDFKEEGTVNLANYLIREKITIYDSVVTVFRNFVSALDRSERFPKLRLIRTGSEPIHKGDVELFREHFAEDCLLINSMGITETGIVRQYIIDKKTRIPNNSVPVGYKVKGAEILLLDDKGQEVGVNQVGEIAVRSSYVSPGYWQRPDLTEAKFLPDPDGGSERIYLTGDLGRMFPDGCLEHLGRKDYQVKIRGYRIEVAEIETALLEHPNIRESVVAGREDQSGGTRLVGYFVPTRKPVPTISELRGFLKGKLSDYMVPSAFVMLEALPLTPNGKVDRKALPMPDQTRPQLDQHYVAPRTPVEESLSLLWGELLGINQVGIHDNFFDLGGHSLLLTQRHSKLQAVIGTKLPIVALFRYPTVSALARYLSRESEEQPTYRNLQDRARRQKKAWTRQKRTARGA